MKNLTIIDKPYSDDKLVFDESTGRYELALQYLKNENGGQVYADDGVAQRRIKLNSRVVYKFINNRVANTNRELVKFLLHRTKEGRQFLLDILSEQQYADIETGYNDLIYSPAVSFTGQDKDRNEIRRNSLCVAAEDVFLANNGYFGFNIGYAGPFPAWIYTIFNK